MTISTVLSIRFPQVLAAACNAIMRCSPIVVPLFPPTGSAGVVSFKPTFVSSTLLMVIFALAKALVATRIDRHPAKIACLTDPPPCRSSPSAVQGRPSTLPDCRRRRFRFRHRQYALRPISRYSERARSPCRALEQARASLARTRGRVPEPALRRARCLLMSATAGSASSGRRRRRRSTRSECARIQLLRGVECVDQSVSVDVVDAGIAEILGGIDDRVGDVGRGG